MMTCVTMHRLPVVNANASFGTTRLSNPYSAAQTGHYPANNSPFFVRLPFGCPCTLHPCSSMRQMTHRYRFSLLLRQQVLCSALLLRQASRS